VLLRKRPLVRDGVTAISVGIVWSVGATLLSRRDGIICDVPRYLLDGLMRPAQSAINKVLFFALSAAGMIPKPGDEASLSNAGVWLAVSIEIFLMMLYVFLLGSIIGLVWRAIRMLVGLALGGARHQS
jgi:hypothetical protein